jgi:hypothetical protein
VAALALVAGVVYAASGDDGDSKLASGAAGTSDDASPPAALASATTAAPSAATETRPVATDEDYLRHVCAASTAFQRRFEEATANIKPTNAEEALTGLVQALGAPLDTLANDLDRANPPEDLEQWHKDAVTRVRQTAKDVTQADRADELGRLLILQDGPFPKPPAAAAERLEKAAAGIKECEGVSAFSP